MQPADRVAAHWYWEVWRVIIACGIGASAVAVAAVAGASDCAAVAAGPAACATEGATTSADVGRPRFVICFCVVLRRVRVAGVAGGGGRDPGRSEAAAEDDPLDVASSSSLGIRHRAFLQ